MWEEFTKRIQKKIIGSEVSITDGDEPPIHDFYMNSYIIIVTWHHEGLPYAYRHMVRKEIYKQMPGDVLIDHLSLLIDREIQEIQNANKKPHQ